MTLCPEPGAGEGNCPENSLIGTVQALTGPGADPFLVTNGKVYLTGGYKGAPFGLSIVVPAVAGPYTLEGTNGKGDVVVRAAINVNKEDAQLTVTADPLPTELDGVPLQIKVLDVHDQPPGIHVQSDQLRKDAHQHDLHQPGRRDGERRRHRSR